MKFGLHPVVGQQLLAGEAAVDATILIVDDDAHNRRLLETLLHPEGYRTRSAANGKEALASIALHAPELDVRPASLQTSELSR